MKARSLFLFAAVATAASMAGCSGGCGKTDSASVSAPGASASGQAPPLVSASGSVAPRAGRPIRGGAIGMLLPAARGIELKDPQKEKLTALEDKLREEAPAKNDYKELEADLAAQIRSGKLDPAKLKTRQETIDKLADERHDRDLAAVASLHALLEPAQRKAIAANVRAKQAEREERMAKRHDKPDPSARVKMRVDRMTRELSLDTEQQKTLEAALKAEAPTDPDEVVAETKKRTETLLAAFEQDTFDPKKLGDLKPKKRAGRAGAEEEMLSKLVPTLRPDQREALAARTEARGRGRRGPPDPRASHGDPSDDD